MKLWGGRFEGAVNDAAHSFNSSIGFDQRLYRQDICGSIAHAKMLAKQGIIGQKDSDLIVAELNTILADINTGKLVFDENAEDIHSFVESELVRRIGDTGKRLHTARSRNDQVALDMRMYVKDEIKAISELLDDLLHAFYDTASNHIDTIMPGFTHLQKAQPITLAHHVLAYFQMFYRDLCRFEDCFARVDEMPLGSGALASGPYPLDRDFVAKELDFFEITQNSLDAVSDRDYCIELLSCIAITMMHLSRFCEELIIWSTEEFSFVHISDGYSTGSSIMPQKKNPDMAELIRGKTGRVYGALMGLLTMMKSLPLAYNKDMQEDKEAVFDAVDTVKASLLVFTGMFKELTFNKEAMRKSAGLGFTNATDAADWLVKKGMPFREAHEVIGKMVLYAINQKKDLCSLTLDELKSLSETFDETIYDAISIEACVNARENIGGPAKVSILKALAHAKECLE